MRTHLFRGVSAAAMLLALSAAPAWAQSVVRGMVVDGTGKPVPDATILFEAEGANRKTTTKTDSKGQFLQVGLQSGSYKVTASKDGVGSQSLPGQVRQGPNPEMKFTLTATSAVAKEERQQLNEVQKLASEAISLMNSGQREQAIAKLNEVLVKTPNCVECYFNIATMYKDLQKPAEAEAAFKKVVELKPDSGSAYSELANIYNAQKRFDLATEASANAAKYLAAAGGVAGAEALYNQGVTNFNAGKFADARSQFEAAVKADPNHALAQYQLGMTALNLGDFPAAVAALEQYLKVDPTGPKAAEIKGQLPALQALIKK